MKTTNAQIELLNDPNNIHFLVVYVTKNIIVYKLPKTKVWRTMERSKFDRQKAKLQLDHNSCIDFIKLDVYENWLIENE